MWGSPLIWSLHIWYAVDRRVQLRGSPLILGSTAGCVAEVGRCASSSGGVGPGRWSGVAFTPDPGRPQAGRLLDLAHPQPPSACPGCHRPHPTSPHRRAAVIGRFVVPAVGPAPIPATRTDPRSAVPGSGTPTGDLGQAVPCPRSPLPVRGVSPVGPSIGTRACSPATTAAIDPAGKPTCGNGALYQAIARCMSVTWTKTAPIRLWIGDGESAGMVILLGPGRGGRGRRGRRGRVGCRSRR